ncbi:MAG: LCP family protein [Clostridia bacterium]|nr:LCP family protein [Clostridia bacterium]
MNSLRNFFITFLIALLVFGICAYFVTGFLNGSIRNLLSGNRPDETTSEVSEEVTTEPVEEENPILGLKGESFTILLIGTDYRPSLYNDYHPNLSSQYPTLHATKELIGYNGTLPAYPYRSVNADAVVMVCVNKEEQTIAYLPIPSNTLLNIGGVNTTIAELYYDKGLEYFVNKMSGITGVPVDYFALVSVEWLVGAVNIMGGVTYDVPCNMQYEDENTGLKINLRKGSQEIDGNKAAQLLAFNSYEDGNLSREKTALGFLQALALKMTNVANVNKAADVLTDLKKYVYTNVTAEDLANNLEMIFAYSKFKIASLEYPGSYFTRDEKQYFNPYINLAINKMSQYK